MDIASTDLALKILGVLVPAYVASKLPSDLRLNRVTQKKHVAELLQEMTGWLKDKSTVPHPLVIQAKFQAALGGYLTRLPDGQEILDFLENEKLATLINGLNYASSLEFVAYSKPEKTFVPRAPWTREKLRARWRREFFFYLITATPSVAFIFTPHFQFARLALALPLIFIAIVKAIQASQVAHAEKLLQQAPQEASKAATPTPPTEAAKPEAQRA